MNNSKWRNLINCVDLQEEFQLEKPIHIIDEGNLKWSYLIPLIAKQIGWSFQNFPGIHVAYELITKKQNNKVVMYWPLELNDINKLLANATWVMCLKERELLKSKINFQYRNFIDNQLEDVSFKKPLTILSPQEITELERNIGWQYISQIRHDLKYVLNPQNPETQKDKEWLKNCFALCQKYFPGLNTIEKMIDYVSNINPHAVPEVMKWQRIEWIYVDIDGTLIEYVPIWSDQEGKQKLQAKVVELIKNYESNWKKIYLRTGWDTKIKELYLKSLWINRPVLNKYDYAWATAEVVIDDTDRLAFITQSKITPETYIDVNNL